MSPERDLLRSWLKSVPRGMQENKGNPHTPWLVQRLGQPMRKENPWQRSDEEDSNRTRTILSTAPPISVNRAELTCGPYCSITRLPELRFQVRTSWSAS